MTSRSDGSSADMSWVIRSRCRADISGNGAVLSSPRMERMSWRIVSTPCSGSLGEACSLKSAGMLFWPKYREASAESSSSGKGV